MRGSAHKYSFPIPPDENGCWIWPGPKSADGYGKHLGMGAHRWTYEKYVGPIPEGLELDHLCRVVACCNPDHLEPVTHAENKRRRYALYTHCANGHEFTDLNTYRRPNGNRDCRTCIRDRVRRYKQRRSAA